MALDACVTSILCGLSSPVLRALSAIITVQEAQLTALIAEAQAQLLVLDVATIPLEAARGIANTALDKVRSAATLVPLEIIAECADLGDFNLNLADVIDAATVDLNDTVDELNRLLSFKEELQASIVGFSDSLSLFGEIQAVIQECGQ